MEVKKDKWLGKRRWDPANKRKERRPDSGRETDEGGKKKEKKEDRENII